MSSIANLKISDGDLIIINLEGNAITSRHIEAVREKVKKWCSSKGMVNVDVLITAGEHKMTIGKLSVNDVFENEILKGENNG